MPEDSVVNPKKVSEVLAHLAYQGGKFFLGEIIFSPSKLCSSLIKY